ncbi:MAG: permease [Gemmatales bacterium]|nr:permease [Gemmatales bacterium]MDW8387106.1 permease [Gemmatales bacterium]
MLDTIVALFWGAVLRVGQAVIEASPFVLTGLIVAGVFRRILGRSRVFRLFGGNTWKGLPLAWVLGMLLPVCSLGAFPILRELRKAGLAGGTILAFALSMPLFNPLSVLYGLTLSEPVVIFCFVLASLVVVTLAGMIWDRIFPASASPTEELPPVAPGLRRMFAILVAAAEEAAGPTLLYIAIGLAGVALLSVVLPHGILQHTMAHNDPTSPLLMSAVALPVYDSPLRVMMQIGLMFDHGNSVGAALVLLILGAGVQLGTVAWVTKQLGWRPALAWFGIIAAVTVGLAYALEKPLFDEGATIEDHTHAFDEFTAPALGGSVAELPSFVLGKLNDDLDPWELLSLIALGVLVLGGVAVRRLERFWSLNAWLERTPPALPDVPLPFWNRPLPGSVLGTVALVGLIVFSIYGCYLYYPAPEEAFELTRPIKVNTLMAIKLGQRDQARRGIRLWDDMIRKTEVGVYLRYGRVNAEVQWEAASLREVLEEAYDGFERQAWTQELGDRWFYNASKGADRFRRAVLRQVGKSVQ